MSKLSVMFDYTALLALAGLYALAATFVGLWICRRLGGEPVREDPLVAAASALTLGQGVLGILWQTLAALKLFYAAVVAPILLTACVWGFFCYQAQCLKRGRINSAGLQGAPFKFDVAAVIGIATVLTMLLYAPLSLLPPGTDAMAFYLSQPKLIAATHGMTPLSGYESFGQIGLGSEMHYAAFYVLGGGRIGELSGKLFVWMSGGAILILTWGIAKRVGVPVLGRWFSAIMVLGSTAFTLILWDGKTDLLPCALALSGIHFVLGSARSNGNIALAGLAAGLACVNKLSYLPSFCPTIGILLARQVYLDCHDDGSRTKRMATTGARFAAFATLPFLALSLKNGLTFGEPFSPFIMLGSGKSFPLDQAWFSPENTHWIVSTYPFALVFGQYPMQHGNLSALVLASLPLLLLGPVRRSVDPAAAWLALAGLAGVVSWVVLRPAVLAPRYILPSLIVLTPLAGAALVWLWRADRIWGRLTVGILVSLALYLTAYEARVTLKDNRDYLSRLPRENMHPIWRTADMANNSPRPETRVYNLMYYSSIFRSDLLVCLIAPSNIELGMISDSMEKFWSLLHRRGVTHVAYDRLTHERQLKTPMDPKAAPAWLVIEETVITDRFRVYELRPKPGAPSVEESCAADSGVITATH